MFDLGAIPVPYRTFPPAGEDEIARAEAAVGVRLPDDFRRFLKQTNGLCVEDYGQIVEGTAGIVETNAAHHVQDALPGYVQVGSEGGGYVVLLAPDGPVVRGEHGSLGPVELTPIAPSFTAWVAGGCRLPAASQSGIDWSAPAEVTLVASPPGGSRDLAAIRTALSLDIGLGDLKNLASRPPVHLPASLTYGQAMTRVERLGAIASCLRVAPRGASPGP